MPGANVYLQLAASNLFTFAEEALQTLWQANTRMSPSGIHKAPTSQPSVSPIL